MHSCFYNSLLNHKGTSSLPGQPEPSFHYIQKFYKSHTKIKLLNNKTHKIFDSHNKPFNLLKLILTDQKRHIKAHKTSNLCHITYQKDITLKHYI